MRISKVVINLILFLTLLLPVNATANSLPSSYESTMSETLELWRDGHYEQLFERLAKRGKTSREQFAEKMRHSTIKPACCWQKMENFRVLDEKKKAVTVYVKIGLEGQPGSQDSVTREFKLLNEHGQWKMQMNDITALAGITKKKHKKAHRKIVRHY